MPIQKIRVTNFKSFGELEIELNQLNVLIGANASGKSNFLQIFRFLRDITNHGLKNAISLQGGVEYFRNVVIGASEYFSLEVVYRPKIETPVWRIFSGNKKQDVKKAIHPYFYESNYRFSLGVSNKKTEFKIVEDRLDQKLKFFEFEKPEQGERDTQVEELGTGTISFRNSNGTLESSFASETIRSSGIEDIAPEISDILGLPNIMSTLGPETLLMESPLFDVINPFEKSLHNIPIYDFDPKLPKKAVPITGKIELEEDGSNLAIVLKNILEDDEQKRKFSNLSTYLLPFIKDLRVEEFSDKSLLVTLQEKYAQQPYFPAPFISDGTIHLTALIVALYFGEQPLIIIEEPERNVHPFLISKVIHMLEDASANKQVIVTTHNPEMVRNAALENIMLISRDEAGFSTISRPSEKEHVKTFLEHEIGLEELYAQDLLGV